MSWLPKKEVVWKNAMNLLREEVIICFFGWELLRSRIGVFFRSPFVVSSFSFKQWWVSHFRFSLLLTFPIRENFFIQKNRECHQLGDFPFLLVPRANTRRKKAHQTYLDHDSWPFLKSSSLRRQAWMERCWGTCHRWQDTGSIASCRERVCNGTWMASKRDGSVTWWK